MTASAGRAGTRTRHGDDAKLYSTWPRQKQLPSTATSLTLAQQIALLGINLALTPPGRHVRDCLACRAQRRISAMPIDILPDGGARWHCGGCGMSGQFSVKPTRRRAK